MKRFFIRGISTAAAYLDLRLRARNPVRRRWKKMTVITRIVKRVSNFGMLVCLAVNVIAVILGAEGLHVASGALFLFFFAMHFLRHRELVFA